MQKTWPLTPHLWHLQSYDLQDASVLAERLECATVNIAAAWVRAADAVIGTTNQILPLPDT